MAGREEDGEKKREKKREKEVSASEIEAQVQLLLRAAGGRRCTEKLLSAVDDMHTRPRRARVIAIAAACCSSCFKQQLKKNQNLRWRFRTAAQIATTACVARREAVVCVAAGEAEEKSKEDSWRRNDCSCVRSGHEKREKEKKSSQVVLLSSCPVASSAAAE